MSLFVEDLVPGMVVNTDAVWRYVEDRDNKLGRLEPVVVLGVERASDAEEVLVVKALTCEGKVVCMLLFCTDYANRRNYAPVRFNHVVSS